MEENKEQEISSEVKTEQKVDIRNESKPKKKTNSWWVLIIILILAIILILLLVIKPTNNGKPTFEDGSILNSEYCSKLDNKITIIHEKGCSACAIAIPRIESIEKELDLTFAYYDLIEPGIAAMLNDKGLLPDAIPTIIIDCKIYKGVKSEEEYKIAILEAVSF